MQHCKNADIIITGVGDRTKFTLTSDMIKNDSVIIDVAITPNRADCLGVRGIARDLASSGLGVLKNQPPIKINQKLTFKLFKKRFPFNFSQ